MNESTSSETETRQANESGELEQAIAELRDLGRIWAVYGLEAGRTALETSASTLRTTASVLGKLARHIEAVVGVDQVVADEDEAVRATPHERPTA